MKATQLYNLAQREGACSLGLAWLLYWMEEHPEGTASQFFRDQALELKGWSPVSTHWTPKLMHYGWLCWCWWNLLDWNCFGHRPGSTVCAKAIAHWLKDSFGIDATWKIPPDELALALARAFDDETED